MANETDVIDGLEALNEATDRALKAAKDEDWETARELLGAINDYDAVNTLLLQINVEEQAAEDAEEPANA